MQLDILNLGYWYPYEWDIGLYLEKSFHNVYNFFERGNMYKFTWPYKYMLKTVRPCKYMMKTMYIAVIFAYACCPKHHLFVTVGISTGRLLQIQIIGSILKQ